MSLESLLSQMGVDEQINDYPIDQWHPESCGDIDIRIARDGSWWHEGTRIRRERLVRLFSALLKCEEGQHYLITPVEKMRIQVEDRPLQVVFIDDTGEGTTAVTADGRTITIGDDHPLKFSVLDGVQVAEVYVNHGLWARFNRNAFYELATKAEEGSDGRFLLTIAGTTYFLDS